jgi:uncharacterized SAM-binding protein YcdF (DUF218 family)
MFFVASKLLGFFLVPSNILVGLGLLGAILLPTRFARAGRRLLVASVLLIAVVGVLPVGVALTLPLENRFPRWDPANGAPDVIVVLGGVINPDISIARSQVALTEAAERMTTAVKLARRYPVARIVFTGGAALIVFSGGSEANFAFRFWENLGVPNERILLEKRSRSTAENAAFTKQLIAPKQGERWLLITSAMHMPRAMGVFRKAGLPVDAYPVDYQTTGPGELFSISSSLMGGIPMTDDAVHEWLGLLAYWMTGRIEHLFPAPARHD